MLVHCPRSRNDFGRIQQGPRRPRSHLSVAHSGNSLKICLQIRIHRPQDPQTITAKLTWKISKAKFDLNYVKQFGSLFE